MKVFYVENWRQFSQPTETLLSRWIEKKNILGFYTFKISHNLFKLLVVYGNHSVSQSFYGELETAVPPTGTFSFSLQYWLMSNIFLRWSLCFNWHVTFSFVFSRRKRASLNASQTWRLWLRRLRPKPLSKLSNLLWPMTYRLMKKALTFLQRINNFFSPWSMSIVWVCTVFTRQLIVK